VDAERLGWVDTPFSLVETLNIQYCEKSWLSANVVWVATLDVALVCNPASTLPACPLKGRGVQRSDGATTCGYLHESLKVHVPRAPWRHAPYGTSVNLQEVPKRQCPNTRTHTWVFIPSVQTAASTKGEPWDCVANLLMQNALRRCEIGSVLSINYPWHFDHVFMGDNITSQRCSLMQ
jgi:hypothetical protein